MTEPRNNAPKTRGRPFGAGNPGRPKGSRHKATLAAEALLDGDAERLTQKAIDLAVAGDATALRLCLERILPPRRDRTITFKLPPIASAQDYPAAIGALLAATAKGHLAPAEAQAIASLLDGHRKALDLATVDARIDALERAAGR